MAQKRRKKRRRGGKAGARGPRADARPATGGGVMQSLRSGFRRAAGVESANDGPSTKSNVLWTLLLVAAVAFFLYRMYG